MRTVLLVCTILLCQTLLKINGIDDVGLDGETIKFMSTIFWVFVIFDIVEFFTPNKTYVKKEGTN